MIALVAPARAVALRLPVIDVFDNADSVAVGTSLVAGRAGLAIDWRWLGSARFQTVLVGHLVTVEGVCNHTCLFASCFLG